MNRLPRMIIAVSLPLVAVVVIVNLFSAQLAQARPPVRPLAAPGDCVVTTTVDSGPGSLRECILGLQSGAMITFSASIFPPSNPATITLLMNLPNIITDNVTLDGSNAGVILDGSSINGFGVVIDGASYVTIKGLHILNFSHNGIRLQNGASYNTIGGTNATPGGPCSGDCNLISGIGWDGVSLVGNDTMSNTVSGNYIGVNVSGTAAISNTNSGISIGGAAYNLIGGATPGERNVINGNFLGFNIISGAHHNRIQGNYVGVNAAGSGIIGNANAGIAIGLGAHDNLVGGNNSTPGGSCTGECNLISGNGDQGIQIEDIEDSGTDNNTVSGNYIGTDISGTATLGNRGAGISLNGTAAYNVVGGDTPDKRNLISGNGEDGISIYGTANTVRGNYIGVNVNGTTTLGNGSAGVFLRDGATYNLIGGSNATPDGNCTGACNLISGNSWDGVALRNSGTMSNTISGNFIGTDVTGQVGLGNGAEDDGVGIRGGPQYNIVGGTTPGQRNLISANGDNGVKTDGMDTQYNIIIGNYIGTNAQGTAAIPNLEDGVAFQGSSHNRLGGTSAAERNLISGNGESGVNIRGGSSYNQVSGNYIGTNVNGDTALGNTTDGIMIASSSANNLIGGDTPGERNLVSGNGEAGIFISDMDTVSNTISGNYIGTNVSGTAAISNHWVGVFIGLGAQYNIVGGTYSLPPSSCTGDCNLVSGNGTDGVIVSGALAYYNHINGNFIGTDLTGLIDLGNGERGVGLNNGDMSDGAKQNTVQANLISGNDWNGMDICGRGVENNLITYNFIGVNATGNGALPNRFRGIAICNGSQGNTIGPGNLIAYNGYTGVGVGWEVAPLNNKITQNSIYSNTNKGIDLFDGGNLELFPPMLTDFGPTYVEGIAPAGSMVEVFSDAADEGQYYHGFTTAGADGHFNFTPTTPFTGANVTATATDGDGNTSEFSAAYTPLTDAQVMAILQPKPNGTQNQPVTPTIKIGNAGTNEGHITVTVQASGLALGGASYNPPIQVVDLPPLGLATLIFPPLVPTQVGNYDLTAVVTLSGDQNAANNQESQAVAVSSDVIDLWTRDNEGDTGVIPAYPFWQSPDIWVRNSDDSGTEHQDPIANQVNWVYMIVRNRGQADFGGGDTAKVYWHEPSLGIKCGDWALADTTSIPSIPANGGSQLLKFSWTPTRTGHTCLHGEIVSTADPVMNACDIPWDNNLSQRNVDILPGGAGLSSLASGGITFEVTNIKEKPQPVTLIVDVSQVPDANAVRLDLGSDLATRWAGVNGLAQSNGIAWSSGSVVTVVGGAEGKIAGIPFEAGETQTVTLLVNAPSVKTTTVTVYEAIDLGFGVSLNTIVGGNTYIFNTPIKFTYLPVVLKN